MKRAIQVGVFALQLSATALAQSPIPDEIDHAKYGAIHTQSKRVSDAKRANAEQYRIRAQDADAAVAETEADIGAQLRAIQEMRQETADLEREIPNLQAQNSALGVESNQLVSRINGNNQIVRQLGDEMRVLSARLPDAERNLEQTERRLRQVEREFDESARDLRDAEGRERALDRELGESVEALRDKRQRAGQIDGDLSRIRGEIQGVEASLAQARTERAAAQARIERIQDDIRAREQALAPLRAAAERARSEAQAARNARDAVQTQVERARSAFQSAKAQLAQHRQEAAPLPGQISTLQSELDALVAQGQGASVRAEKLRGRIANQTARLSELQGLISSAESAVAQTESELRSAQADLQQAEALVQGLRSAAQQAEAAVATGEGEISQARQRLQAAQQSLQDAVGSISALTGQIDRLRGQITGLEQERQALPGQIAQLEQRVQRLRNEFQQAGHVVNQLRTRVAQLDGLRHRVGEDFVVQRDEVEGMRNRYRELDEYTGRLNEETFSMGAQLQSNQSAIENNRQRIDWDTQKIAANGRDIPKFETYVAQLNARLASQKRASSDAWTAFQPIDADASAAEGNTQRALAQYEAVKATYDGLIAEARAQGAGQGSDAGRLDGERKGKDDGLANGTLEGTDQGRREGLADGLARGKADADPQGYAVGYAHGRASVASYDAGKVEGLKQGDVDAYAFALATERPRGRAAQKAALLAQIPAAYVELDNRMGDRASAEGLRDLNLANGRVAARSRPLDSPAAGTLDQAVAASVTTRIQAAANVGDILGGIGDGVVRASYFSATSLTLTQAQASCQLSYVDFTNACVDSFRAAYQSAYDDSYRLAYVPAKKAAFDVARLAAFDANKQVKYQEGWDSAYPLAYQRGDDVGAHDAQSQGYADGKAQGYARTLDAAKATEFARGQAEERQFFQANAVTRLLDASGVEPKVDGEEPGDVVAGDTVSLTSLVANFGHQPSTRGQLKIKWEALTGNVATVDGTSDVVGMPAVTRASINMVSQARISPSALGGQVARFKVTAYHADGVQDTREVTVNIAPNLQLKIETQDTDETPRIGQQYKVKVKVKNIGREAGNQPIRFVLSSPLAASDLSIDAPQAIVSQALPLNKTVETKDTLAFTVRNPLLDGQSVGLRIVVYHGKNVAVRGTLVIKPHK